MMERCSGMFLDRDVCKWFAEHVPNSATIMDLGAGAGKWSELLRPKYERIDGIEVSPIYADFHKLRDKYWRFALMDIRDWMPVAGEYTAAIWGDVLEHLLANDAITVLGRLDSAGIISVVIVPFRLKQGPLDGIAAQIHHQADLSPEIMTRRFPTLHLYAQENRFGFYLSRGWTAMIEARHHGN